MRVDFDDSCDTPPRQQRFRLLKVAPIRLGIQNVVATPRRLREMDDLVTADYDATSLLAQGPSDLVRKAFLARHIGKWLRRVPRGEFVDRTRTQQGMPQEHHRQTPPAARAALPDG